MNGTIRRKRSGAVLIAVLVALGLLMVTMSVTLQWSLRSRRAVRSQAMVTQADWLCEAGLGRAIRKRRLDPEYLGETWEPSVRELGTWIARVGIEVESSSSNANVRVVAELVDTSVTQVRFQRSLEYRLVEGR
jgi:type II secretory pathway component PulK